MTRHRLAYLRSRYRTVHLTAPPAMIEEACHASDPFVRFADLQSQFEALSSRVLQLCAEFRASALHAAACPSASDVAIGNLALARTRRRARYIDAEVADMLAALAQTQRQALLLAQHCLLSGRNSLYQLHDAILVYDARLPEQVAAHARQSVAALREATSAIEHVVAMSAQRGIEVHRAAAEVAQLAQQMA